MYLLRNSVVKMKKFEDGEHIRTLSDGKGNKRKFVCLYKNGRMIKKRIFSRKNTKPKCNLCYNDKKLDHLCPSCHAHLYVSGYSIYCKNNAMGKKKCDFSADNVLDYWLGMYEHYLDG